MPTQVRAHWKAAIGIVAAVVAAMATAYFISSQSPRVYTADARLVVTAGLGLSPTDAVLEAPQLGQTYAVLATTRPVLLDVIQRTGLAYDPAELASRLSVTADVDTPFMTVSMTDEVPEDAATIANAVAEILVERGAIPASGTGAAATPAGKLLAVVELATIPDGPSGPRTAYNTMLAGAAVLLGGLLLVAGRAYLRNDPSASPPASR